MIQITVNTEENNIRLTCEVNAKGEAAVEEFKTLNDEFPRLLEMLLKKFPLFIQAEILADMISDLHNDEEGDE